MKLITKKETKVVPVSVEMTLEEFINLVFESVDGISGSVSGQEFFFQRLDIEVPTELQKMKLRLGAPVCPDDDSPWGPW